MADPRGGLGSFARNGNSAARTYGAGIRPPSRDPGTGGRPVRARSGAWSVTGGRAAVSGSASAAAAASRSAAAAVGAESGATGTDEGAAGSEAADGDSDDDPDDSDDSDLGGGAPARDGGGCAVRRTVLLSLVGSGAALVAGCGGDDPPKPAGQADQASASPSVSPTPEPSLEPFPGADDGQGDKGDGGGSGLVKTDEVPVGGAVLAGEYLIAQPQRGVFKAFDATCPHQGITVDPPLGTNDYFVCPGHNSKFRLADGGRISGPAPRGLKPVAVKVRNGYVVAA